MGRHRLIHAKPQSPNLKRILANSLSTNQAASVFKCSDNSCQCCQQLLLESSYAFKNIGDQFFFKTKMTCGSRNLIYMVICPTCKEEYIGKTGIGDYKFRGRTRTYRQHIWQPEHEERNVERHLSICTKGNSRIFSLLQLRSNGTDLRREYEDYFIRKYKTKVNNS